MESIENNDRLRVSDLRTDYAENAFGGATSWAQEASAAFDFEIEYTSRMVTGFQDNGTGRKRHKAAASD